MKKIIIIILMLLFLVEAYSDETLYPYFFKYDITNGKQFELLSTKSEFENCHKKILLFHDLWYSVGWDPVILEIDLLENSGMPQLSDYVTRSQTYWAAQNAIDNWNSISYYSTDVFTEYDYNIHTKRVQVWVFEDLQNYPQLGSSVNFAGQIIYCINAYDCYDAQKDVYFIDYETNTGVDPPLEYYGTIIYLDGDPDAQNYFDWIWGENPGSGEADVEHVLMHEYGHALGINDDTTPVNMDNILTLMTQGQGYWSRTVEDPLRNSISLMYGISPSPGLPKEIQNEK